MTPFIQRCRCKKVKRYVFDVQSKFHWSWEAIVEQHVALEDLRIECWSFTDAIQPHEIPIKTAHAGLFI